MKAFLIVHLITQDLVANTTLATLVDDMGYSGELMNLKRDDLWEIELDCKDKNEAERILHKLATQTKLFVNPNKNTFSIHTEQYFGKSRARHAEDTVILGISEYLADTRGDIALASLRKLYKGFEVVQRIRYRTLWSFHLSIDDMTRARELVERIAITRDIDNGLLINPHSQRFEIV